jgi:hypothetical protein
VMAVMVAVTLPFSNLLSSNSEMVDRTASRIASDRLEYPRCFMNLSNCFNNSAVRDMLMIGMKSP